MTPTTATTSHHPKTELAGSPWDEQLLAHFDEHVSGELDLLDAYLGIRDQGPAHVRYLIDMILQDESRHHQTFRELVNRVRSDIDWRDYEPKVPYLERITDDRPSFLATTEQFIGFERDDLKALRKLRKELKPVRNTTLFSLLVELMEYDTLKHIAILEFLRRSAADD